MNVIDQLYKSSRPQCLFVWACGVVLWAISAFFHHWNNVAQSALVCGGLIIVAYSAFKAIVNPRRKTLYNVFYVYWFSLFGLVFFVVTFGKVSDMPAAVTFVLMIALLLWGRMKFSGNVL
jgi:hypothetical protein